MNDYLTKIRITTGPDKGSVVHCDIYDILDAFEVYNVAQAHAAKKLLRGGRYGKDWHHDMNEAIRSITRAIQIAGGRDADPEQ